ncbi:MJ0548 connectase family domain-containing protein [Methanobrevibacter curvatus]|uniref:Uncharacterized protein n=1 Tax=Methanobrevibacter curvatus TaxID=49547 RepID=A0A162FIP2_9EURY|nr:DUF2121 domain-containing protein [Methanobrevibacter curvatus]KZX10570.1 hypothetical protein MBCUR_17540 [Methanobrevibacter curvatus]
MSLIIAYVGKKGCVMVADKRRISYFGDKEDIESLEDKLYSGDLENDEELKKTANLLNVSLKISDKESKIRSLESSLVAEVSTKSTHKAMRKRIYATTNAYQIIELEGSNISNLDKGDSSIIIFGNKITKSLANDFLSKEFKADVSLKYMGDIFTRILSKIHLKTPSIGNEFDVLVKTPKFSKEEAQKYLDDLVKVDIKLLVKFRDKLTQDLFDKSEEIKIASKIINEGYIGVVSKIKNNFIYVKLNYNVQAYNTRWKLLVKPNEEALMFLGEDSIKTHNSNNTQENIVKLGDKILIENEIIVIERNKTPLNCDIILTSV